MARLGITYQDVTNAVNQLLGQGKSPTIETIRHFLGTGSSTTIANHLRKWRMEQEASGTIAVHENLPPDLIAIVQGLWQKILSQAETKVVAIQETTEKTIADLKQEVEKYKRNNQRWQLLLGEWTKEKEQLTTLQQNLKFNKEELEKQNTALHGKLDTFTQQLEEKETRIQELNRLHQQTQSNLEHYRESTREQRLIEQQQFEQQRQGLQSEIKLLTEQVAIQQEKLTSSQQQLHILQQAHAILEKTLDESNAKLAKLQSSFEAIEKEKNEYKIENLQSQKHIHELQKNLDEKLAQLVDSRTEINTLSLQVTHLKQTLDELKSENKILNQDKWELSQEKAQLEGQLKQMHNMMKVKTT